MQSGQALAGFLWNGGDHQTQTARPRWAWSAEASGLQEFLRCCVWEKRSQAEKEAKHGEINLSEQFTCVCYSVLNLSCPCLCGRGDCGCLSMRNGGRDVHHRSMGHCLWKGKGNI